MIGKLRCSQNDKLGCHCERRSEKIKAKERDRPMSANRPLPADYGDLGSVVINQINHEASPK